MDTKDQLITLIRIACAHKVQGQTSKAKEAYDRALLFWAKSEDLSGEDWDEADSEYQHAIHRQTAGVRDYANL